jgi:hypothetical protein
MDTGIIWLVGLFLLEAAVFVVVLFLVRAFTRTYDAEWPRESISTSLDGHADAAQQVEVTAGKHEHAAS